MKEERLQEIIGQLEAEPEKPVLLTRENEADEAYGLLWGTHPGIRLATIHGVSYLAVTDAALQVLVERLERERQQFRVTVQHYDSSWDGRYSRRIIVPYPARKIKEKG